MTRIQLFHGSSSVVEQPLFERCRPFNDYGPAFYCTQSLELAKEWACNNGADGIANRYSLELEGLRVLDLNSSQYCILHWLDLLLQNRTISLATPVMRRGASWLHERFSLELQGFDVVKGYRADDSYFSFARAFVRNEITLQQLSRAMHLGTLGQQYALRTQHAFDALEFEGWEQAPAQVFWAQRSTREAEARSAFATMIAGTLEAGGQQAAEELYISTLMRMGEEELHACLSRDLPE